MVSSTVILGCSIFDLLGVEIVQLLTNSSTTSSATLAAVVGHGNQTQVCIQFRKLRVVGSAYSCSASMVPPGAGSAPGGARYHLRLESRHGHAWFSYIVEEECARLIRQEQNSVVAEMPQQHARVEKKVWRRSTTGDDRSTTPHAAQVFQKIRA